MHNNKFWPVCTNHGNCDLLLPACSQVVITKFSTCYSFNSKSCYNLFTILLLGFNCLVKQGYVAVTRLACPMMINHLTSTSVADIMCQTPPHLLFTSRTASDSSCGRGLGMSLIETTLCTNVTCKCMFACSQSAMYHKF